VRDKELFENLEYGKKIERWFSAEILGSKKKVYFFDNIKKYINDKDIEDVIVWIYGKLRNENAIVLLKEKLYHTNDTYLIHRLVEALIEIGRPSIPALIEILSESKNSEVRWRVAKALGELKAIESFDVLWKYVSDKNKFVRWRCICSIKDFGKKIVPKLVKKLNDKNPYLKWRALWALYQINDKRSMKAIKKVIENDHSDFVKWQAKRSLNKIILGI